MKEKTQKKTFLKILKFFKNSYWRLVIGFALGFIAALFLVSRDMVIYRNDNPTEEIIEKIIRAKFGAKIELAPDSKENHSHKYLKESK